MEDIRIVIIIVAANVVIVVIVIIWLIVIIVVFIVVRSWAICIARCGKQFVLGIVRVIEGVFLPTAPVLEDLVALRLDPYVAEFDLWSEGDNV